jgi:hypothetical protein
MQRLKFSELLATLERLDPWLRSLDIDPKNDRIHSAIELLRQADAISRGEQKPPTREEAEKFYFGLSEALEIHDIFVAFEKADPGILKEKLPRAFSGPHRPADETPKNSDGRNVMFELALGAELIFRGLSAELGDPDVRLRLGRGYFLECKRPFGELNVRSNIRGAADQLEDNLAKDEAAYGVIAVSVSRLLNPGDKLFVTDFADLGIEQLGNLLEKTARSTEHQWRRMMVHPRVCAVLFHVSTPAIVKNDGLITKLSYVQVFGMGKETEEQRILQDAMSHAFRDAVSRNQKSTT